MNDVISWLILTLACVVVSLLWFFAWYRSPWPLVGYIVAGAVVLIPVAVGVAALVHRRRR